MAGFGKLAKLSGGVEIFGQHNPVYEVPTWLSGDAAGELLKFFQQIDSATGTLVHDFTDANWDTRFLGDLYQDLSERARKKYALLQTPNFVEQFILERTLEPAIEEFGLQGFRMIDPACGSGHFLLGSFQRLIDRWYRQDPNENYAVLAQRALDSVHGVDINPFAVAIAWFRLLLAAMKEAGITGLRNAPDFKIHLACGDSLLHGEGIQLELEELESPRQHHYKSEDVTELNQILVPRRYHAVVANPPYIVPKDAAANAAYRKLYRRSCHRQYSLAVPFMERIFQLAVERGFTGQITANSFMKREFGKKLIEEFFPTVDLTHVIDTSGAYIPGHGTPTVILLGRNRKFIGSTIRAVMGIKGEPSTPENAAQGLVWSAIRDQVDLSGSQSEFVSVADSARDLFHQHPWSIGGGGASDLKTEIETENPTKLNDVIETICSLCLTRADDVYLLPHGVLARQGVKREHQLTMVIGEQVRDWGIWEPEQVLYPYDSDFKPVTNKEGSAVHRFLWSSKEILWRRRELGGDHREMNRTWWEWNRFLSHRFQVPLSIAFAFVATHNHFVLDRGGKVFKQSSPVIKLPGNATEDDHLVLLGLLNSSVGAFWMRQVFHDKGGGGIGGGIAAEAWERFFEYDGTKIKALPLPVSFPIEQTRCLDAVAHQWNSLLPYSVLLNRDNSVTSEFLQSKKQAAEMVQSNMISLQEELDWQCYQLYKLIDEDLTCELGKPQIQLGQRAFEIVMARKMAAGELETTWFERHNSTPITELPAHWSNEYKRLVERRIEVIETNKNISLIEQPEYKRRWNTESWDSQLERALQNWLLDRLETYFDFDGRMNDSQTPTAKVSISILSTAKLADLAQQDPDFMQVGALYRHSDTFHLQTLIDELIEAESVPLLPILRYKPSGLRKRAEWEQTWMLQRQEDAIDARSQLPANHPDHLSLLQAQDLKTREISTIPVPPKYTSADFLKSHYWRLRGKLDVPKERWISLPHCEGNDGKPAIAWAGYDHLQLTQALSNYYIEIKENLGGSEDPRLLPLLACLLELLPWLKQWHSAIDPTYGYAMSDYFEDFIQEEARYLNQTLDQIRAWEPPKRPKRR